MNGDIMKCTCSMKRVVKLKHGETEAELKARSLCTNCGKKGQWRILTES
jgi:hypothetical protein